MGNSGGCLSKNTEVEYQTGEAFRSRNSEFTVDNKVADKAKDNKMEAILNEMALKLTKQDLASLKTADKEAEQAVSFWVKNSLITCFSYQQIDKEKHFLRTYVGKSRQGGDVKPVVFFLCDIWAFWRLQSVVLSFMANKFQWKIKSHNKQS